MSDVAAALPRQGQTADPSRWQRLSDRLNPILVREVQQALRGRVFGILVLLALLFSVGLATAVASGGERSAGAGRETFSYCLMALAPLVLFFVPMQAYLSMRHELRAGIVEQLLLSRLRPWRIVAGKLGAAIVQYALYLAVLAPVLSTTYLLRGVDVPTIAVCLLFSLLFCVTATAMALAAATQGLVPMLQPLANLGLAFSLGVLTVATMGAIGDGDLVRWLASAMRNPEWSAVFSAILLGCLVASVLGGMVAATLLSHSFENRSTPFRVLLLCATALSSGWVLVYVAPGFRSESLLMLAAFLTVAGGALGVFLVTEQGRLSPRHRVLVPRAAPLRLLVAPLLPGRDRGLQFVLIHLALLAVVIAAAAPRAAPPALSGRPDFARFAWQLQAFLTAYVLIYLQLVKRIRAMLPEAPVFNLLARAALPLLLVFCCVLPFLLDVLIAGRATGWHVGHALDPFYTMTEHLRRRGSDSGWNVAGGLLVFAAVLLLLDAKNLWRGLGEVLAVRRTAGGERAG